ncbi:hypothetical protein IWW57_000145 [Coemansia sp. S610]|nr:hypothetical protein IWW57_000145 [Coemansia sp. S610]
MYQMFRVLARRLYDAGLGSISVEGISARRWNVMALRDSVAIARCAKKRLSNEPKNAQVGLGHSELKGKENIVRDQSSSNPAPWTRGWQKRGKG